MNSIGIRNNQPDFYNFLRRSEAKAVLDMYKTIVTNHREYYVLYLDTYIVGIAATECLINNPVELGFSFRGKRIEEEETANK